MLAQQETMCGASPWCELRHHLSRLLSYRRAAFILARGCRIRPCLAEGFEVLAIPSSKPAANPFQRFFSTGNTFFPRRLPTAYDLISQMASDQSTIQRYRRYAEELQRFELDDRIREACHSDSRPVVHAEVLILQWLEETGGTPGSRFFLGDRYIASSKPTCRLCHYYFKAHNSGVQVRESHRNLYTKWRVPDLPRGVGKESVKAREMVLKSVMVSLRQDAFRVLRDKRPERKTHDSETNFSAGFRTGHYAADEVDEVIEHFRRVQLSNLDSPLSPTDIRRRQTPASSSSRHRYEEYR